MKRALGRGLQSLIPKKQPASALPNDWTKTEGATAPVKESVFNVEINKIRPNPFQPRREMSKASLKELAASIREHGVLQPLIVSKIEKSTSKGRDVEYELIAGERRWRAAKIASLPHVPVVIRGTSQDKKLEVALVENIQREDLNPIEAALAYRELQDKFGLSQGEIGKKVGKNGTTISNAMRLLNLPEKVQGALGNNEISEGHARAILMVRPDVRLSLFKEIIRRNLNVRQAEERARKLAPPGGLKARSQGPRRSFFKTLETSLEEVLGRRPNISQRGDLGYLRIQFATQEELKKLVQYLLKFRKK